MIAMTPTQVGAKRGARVEHAPKTNIGMDAYAAAEADAATHGMDSATAAEDAAAAADLVLEALNQNLGHILEFPIANRLQIILGNRAELLRHARPIPCPQLGLPRFPAARRWLGTSTRAHRSFRAHRVPRAQPALQQAHSALAQLATSRYPALRRARRARSARRGPRA